MGNIARYVKLLDYFVNKEINLTADCVIFMVFIKLLIMCDIFVIISKERHPRLSLDTDKRILIKTFYLFRI